MLKSGTYMASSAALSSGNRSPRHHFNAVSILVIESSHAASRSSALATRAISAGTVSYCPCSMASRTPGTVFTP